MDHNLQEIIRSEEKQSPEIDENTEAGQAEMTTPDNDNQSLVDESASKTFEADGIADRNEGARDDLGLGDDDGAKTRVVAMEVNREAVQSSKRGFDDAEIKSHAIDSRGSQSGTTVFTAVMDPATPSLSNDLLLMEEADNPKNSASALEICPQSHIIIETGARIYDAPEFNDVQDGQDGGDDPLRVSQADTMNQLSRIREEHVENQKQKVVEEELTEIDPNPAQMEEVLTNSTAEHPQPKLQPIIESEDSELSHGQELVLGPSTVDHVATLKSGTAGKNKLAGTTTQLSISSVPLIDIEPFEQSPSKSVEKGRELLAGIHTSVNAKFGGQAIMKILQETTEEIGHEGSQDAEGIDCEERDVLLIRISPPPGERSMLEISAVSPSLNDPTLDRHQLQGVPDVIDQESPRSKQSLSLVHSNHSNSGVAKVFSGVLDNFDFEFPCLDEADGVTRRTIQGRGDSNQGTSDDENWSLEDGGGGGGPKEIAVKGNGGGKEDDEGATNQSEVSSPGAFKAQMIQEELINNLESKADVRSQLVESSRAMQAAKEATRLVDERETDVLIAERMKRSDIEPHPASDDSAFEDWTMRESQLIGGTDDRQSKSEAQETREPSQTASQMFCNIPPSCSSGQDFSMEVKEGDSPLASLLPRDCAVLDDADNTIRDIPSQDVTFKSSTHSQQEGVEVRAEPSIPEGDQTQTKKRRKEDDGTGNDVIKEQLHPPQQTKMLLKRTVDPVVEDSEAQSEVEPTRRLHQQKERIEPTHSESEGAMLGMKRKISMEELQLKEKLRRPFRPPTRVIQTKPSLSAAAALPGPDMSPLSEANLPVSSASSRHIVTKRLDQSFKSPFSVVRSVPIGNNAAGATTTRSQADIFALEKRIQLCEQALKIVSGDEDDAGLEKLIKQWREAGRTTVERLFSSLVKPEPRISVFDRQGSSDENRRGDGDGVAQWDYGAVMRQLGVEPTCLKWDQDAQDWEM